MVSLARGDRQAGTSPSYVVRGEVTGVGIFILSSLSRELADSGFYLAVCVARAD